MLLFRVAGNEVDKHEAEALTKSANTSSARYSAGYEETNNNGQNSQGIYEWPEVCA